jgi:hypothetical protein
MTRSRMTTRRWMVAVAVVGLLLGVVVGGQRLKQRRDYCLQQASKYARMETDFRSMEARSATLPPRQRTLVFVDRHAYQAATLAACFAERKEIYLHAASRPWLSVPPPLPVKAFILVERPAHTFVDQKTGRPPAESRESPSP